ncbi:MAG: DNRLRE domain-containing protein, partial [Chloroflexi bacterium]|nr:DNRLRE domain-containing protein [Chloroflexota bacterium]
METIKKSPILGVLLVVVGLLAFGMDSVYSSTSAQNGGGYQLFAPRIAAAAEGTNVSVPAGHDAYVRSQYPQRNYGSANVLRVRVASDNNNYSSYLKFTVSGITGSVTQAKLRLYATDGNDDGVSVYSVSNNYRNTNSPWTEAGLNWNNAPTMGGAPLAASGPIANNSWMELNVTSAVAGNGTYSFAVNDLSANSVYYNSSEASTNRPVLLVEYGGQPGPTATPLPTTTAVPPTPTAGPPPPTSTPGSPPTSGQMWISSATLASLPTSGTAWNNLWDAAQQNTNSPNISDQNDMTDVYVLAKALVYARTGQSQYRNEVMTAITAAMGSESGTGILAVARNLQAYVIAADLINLPVANPVLNTTFRQWLATVRTVVFSGAGPALSIIGCHEERPNNFGTHCGASRIAIALYLGDTAELQDAANVFKGWLGDRNAYAGFNYGDLDWQCNPSAPVGINPAGC